MNSVGTFEAKTHLASLLARVSQGETIIITKHGKPIARLVPPTESATNMSVDDAIAGLLEFRKTHSIGMQAQKELIEEGRKY